MKNSLQRLALGIAAAATLCAGTAHAAKTYSTGASDTEIRIGNTVPYSGPLSVYGVIGRTEAAYFKKLNDAGGINGRKVTFISYDDAYSPPKALEQVRKLVESDEVLAVFGMVGSPSNAAVMKYMNQKKVPQLFTASGAAKFSDPQGAPWTIGWIPSYRAEARTYVKDILATNAKAKIGIVFQNDDFGKDYLAGVKEVLAGKPNVLIEAPFETSAPTLDSQIVSLKDSGADALIIAGIGKFASQAIRKAAELGWKPLRYVTNTAIAVDTVLKPAGLEAATGLVSIAYKKDPGDPAWAQDAAMKEFFAFMDTHLPGEPKNDQSAVGYMQAKTLEQVLRQCGDELTRENLMKQAANLKQFPLPLLLPGISLDTSPTDYSPIKKLQTQRFDGHHWGLFGTLVDATK
ncbi:MAG: ABC transporter substrate-binding protein [Burkholderiales bacterium]